VFAENAMSVIKSNADACHLPLHFIIRFVNLAYLRITVLPVETAQHMDICMKTASGYESTAGRTLWAKTFSNCYGIFIIR